MADAKYTELEYDKDTGAAVYSDVDLSFKVHPTTGDLIKTKNSTVIKQSMRSVLQTREFERIGHPEIGSNLQTLLFEPMNTITEARLKQSIEVTMQKLEPRAIIRGIQVIGEDNNNRYRVKIVFTMMGQQSSETFEQFLYR
jgi:phage baseplate assembly protein W|tara:strand:- start:28303 stop:28725 length:423 start_codon:yes stop_codon:yes gene_type:complete